MFLEGCVSAAVLLKREMLDPTLILSVSSLYLLVCALLNLPLQYSCPSWLVIVCDFQNVRCVDPIILTTAHHMVPANVKFVDWDLVGRSVSHQDGCPEDLHCYTWQSKWNLLHY